MVKPQRLQIAANSYAAVPLLDTIGSLPTTSKSNDVYNGASPMCSQETDSGFTLYTMQNE